MLGLTGSVTTTACSRSSTYNTKAHVNRKKGKAFSSMINTQHWTSSVDNGDFHIRSLAEPRTACIVGLISPICCLAEQEENKENIPRYNK